jgi:hypothetical protein
MWPRVEAEQASGADEDRPLTADDLAAANSRTFPDDPATRARLAAEAAARERAPVVDRPEDVPAFVDDDAWVAFWETHRIGPNLTRWLNRQRWER